MLFRSTRNAACGMRDADDRSVDVGVRSVAAVALLLLRIVAVFAALAIAAVFAALAVGVARGVTSSPVPVPVDARLGLRDGRYRRPGLTRCGAPRRKLACEPLLDIQRLLAFVEAE